MKGEGWDRGYGIGKCKCERGTNTFSLVSFFINSFNLFRLASREADTAPDSGTVNSKIFDPFASGRSVTFTIAS
jgi:hypothetical protein